MRANGLVFNTRDPDGAWGPRRRVPGTGGLRILQSIAVAGEQGSTQVQLMFVDSEGLIWHGICDQTPGGAVWSPFARPWGQMKAQSVALDVEGGNAQVVVKDHSDRLATASGCGRPVLDRPAVPSIALSRPAGVLRRGRRCLLHQPREESDDGRGDLHRDGERLRRDPRR